MLVEELINYLGKYSKEVITYSNNEQLIKYNFKNLNKELSFIDLDNYPVSIKIQDGDNVYEFNHIEEAIKTFMNKEDRPVFFKFSF